MSFLAAGLAGGGLEGSQCQGRWGRAHREVWQLLMCGQHLYRKMAVKEPDLTQASLPGSGTRRNQWLASS